MSKYIRKLIIHYIKKINVMIILIGFSNIAFAADLNYSTSNFVESDGGGGSVTGEMVITLTGDTFQDSDNDDLLDVGTELVISNIPLGLTAAAVLSASDTVVTITLSGNAASNTVSDSVANLDFAFDNAAFTGGDASVVTNSGSSAAYNAAGVQFNDPTINYYGSFEEELDTDFGYLNGSRVMQLIGATFAVSGELTETTHYTLSNVPAGLVGKVYVSGQYASLIFDDTRTSDRTNINDLTITFADAVFTSLNASDVQGSSDANGSISFNSSKLVLSSDKSNSSRNHNYSNSDTWSGVSSVVDMDVLGNGEEVLAAKNNDPNIYVYSLTTTGNVNSVSTSSPVIFDASMSGVIDITSADSIHMSSTGDKLYVLQEDKRVVHQYSVSPAYTVSNATVTYDGLGEALDIDSSLAFDPALQFSSASDMDFSNDGAMLYIANKTDDRIYQYLLVRPWDVSTAIYLQRSSEFDFPIEGGGGFTPSGIENIEFSEAGDVIFVTVDEDDIYRFPLSEHYNSSKISTSQVDAYVINEGFQSSNTKTALYYDNENHQIHAIDGGNKLKQFNLSNNISYQETSENGGAVDGLPLYVYALGSSFSDAVGSVPCNSSASIVSSSQPSGLELNCNFTSNKSLTITVTGEADSHDGNWEGDFSIDFGGSTRNVDTYFSFMAQPSLAYSSVTPFVESSTSDGSVTGSFTATISGGNGEVFNAADGTDLPLSAYSVNNLPTGLTPKLTITSSGTIATLTFDGNASNQYGDVTGLQLSFNDGAFTNSLKAEDVNSNISSNFTASFFSLFNDISSDANNADGINNRTSGITATQLNASTGVSGALSSYLLQYKIAIVTNEGPFTSPEATAQEVQDMIDHINAINDVYLYSSSDANNSSNGTAITLSQLQAIKDYTNAGASLANIHSGYIAAYQAAINVETAFSNPATFAQIQTLIDRVNTEQGILANIYSSHNGGTSVITHAELSSLPGVTGVITANEAAYQTQISATTSLSNPPTAAELNNIIAAANASQDSLVAILNASTSNDGSALTIAQLNAITGIEGIDSDNLAQYQVAIAAASGLTTPVPTLAEVQAIIDQVNSDAALVEALEDSASAGGANNANGVAITAEDLKLILGVTAATVKTDVESYYPTMIAAEAEFSNLITAAEVQAVIDHTNALYEVLEDSGSTGGMNNTNGSAVTIAQLEQIKELNNIISGNEAAYQADIAAATHLDGLPTVAQVQAIIDKINSDQALLAILEDSTSGGSNSDGNSVTASQLKMVQGLERIFDEYEADYQTAIASATGLSNPPTVAEVQVVIDAVNTKNALAEILEDSASTGGANNTNGIAVTIEQILSITDLKDVMPLSVAGYQDAFKFETEFSNPPTLSEVQVIIDRVNATDSDNDGIPDAAEGFREEPPRDTDGDGTPDYLDTDSDNDGILDINETTEGSSILRDTDGDGIPDYVDRSSATDDLDSDGDGFTDKEECPNYPSCPDSDGDGLADYFDKAGEVESGVSGAGSLNVSILGLLLLFVLYRSRKLQVFIATSLLAVGAVQADEKEFHSAWYLGLGAGQSTLEPEVNDSGYELDSDSDTGYSVFGGYDINRHLSAEVFYNELGEANLKHKVVSGSEESFGYKNYGASALWYLEPFRSGSNRHGFQLYLEAGVSSMQNDTKVANNQKNSTQIHLGGGLEYGWDNGWALRGKVASYDKDVTYLSLGVLKRFGFESNDTSFVKNEPVVEEGLVAEETVAIAETVEPVIEEPSIEDELKALAPEPVLEKQPSTKQLSAKAADKISQRYCFLFDQVGQDDCGVRSGVDGYVLFSSNSSYISESFMLSLDRLVTFLHENPNVKVQMSAHTDSSGSEKYNKFLADRRAKKAKDYLVKKGISPARLEAEGLGEQFPIASNDTEEGKAMNRRLEFKLDGDITSERIITSDE